MKHYQTALTEHLVEYKERRLGIQESGTYNGRSYRHILPPKLRFLNLLEGIRAEVQVYLRAHPQVKLHRYFHHLNSSQAFAFNLFYPYFSSTQDSARVLGEALGAAGDVREWEFECVPDSEEGTNVDVSWCTSAKANVFCEVKLSEQEFGRTENDLEHQKKLAKTYRPRLQGLVDAKLLDERPFFRHYQLLRNIWLLSLGDSNQVVFLIPKENDGLHTELNHVLRNLTPTARQRVHVVYFEELLARLSGHRDLSSELRNHALRMQEKYVIG